MTTPAVVYGVKSNPDDRESVADQHRIVLDAMPDDRSLVAEPFGEDNKSGYRKSRGPQLEAAMNAAVAAADEHGHAELWVFHSSRLARGSGMKDEARSLLEVFTQMRRAGVTLRSVSDDLYVTDEAAIGMAAKMANKYSEDLSAHIKRGMRRKAERGEHLSGQLPDGYGKDDQGEIVLDCNREDVVRGILELAKEGKPDAAIARSLNARGITTRKSNPWTRPAVRKLVTNPFYCGRIRHGDDLFDGDHPRYIEPADWDRLQATRPTQTRGPRGRRAKRHALQGLAICAACGRRMVAFTSPYRRKDGTRARAYRCRGYAECNGSCSVYQFDAQLIDTAVLAALDDLLPDFEAWMLQQTQRQSGERERLESQLANREAERHDQAKRVGAVEAKWTEYITSGDDAKADAVVPMVERERKSLSDAQTRVQAAQDALDATPVDAHPDHLLDFAAALQKALSGVDTTGSVAQVNAALGEMFEGFLLWQEDGVIRIDPMLHLSVGRALMEQSFFHGEPATGPPTWPSEPDPAVHPDAVNWLVRPDFEPPPMRWLEAACRNSDYSPGSEVNISSTGAPKKRPSAKASGSDGR
jgi:DNA invertase Pin-like site-specific DNA recombinase